MSDDEMRIAVAECCGWVPETRRAEIPEADFVHEETFWRKGDQVSRGPWLPNYPADLNACASFEETLTTLDKQAEYRDALMMAVGLNPHYWEWQTANEFCRCVSATARQRCEAFLKVKGLWKP